MAQRRGHPDRVAVFVPPVVGKPRVPAPFFASKHKAPGRPQPHRKVVSVKPKDPPPPLPLDPERAGTSRRLRGVSTPIPWVQALNGMHASRKAATRKVNRHKGPSHHPTIDDTDPLWRARVRLREYLPPQP